MADNLGIGVDAVFRELSKRPIGDIAIAVYSFAIQIYGDFWGYSLMAIGLARLLGFELAVNFRTPYFSQGPREFWKRWHITLSQWFQNYLYVPLGGNRCSIFRTHFNLLLTMALAGLWHGAKWTFVIWGLYHGALLVLERIMSVSRKPNFINLMFRVIFTFHLVCLGWLLFRADTLSQVWSSFAKILQYGPGREFLTDFQMMAKLIFFTVPVFCIDLIQWKKDETLPIVFQRKGTRVVVLILIYFGLTIYGVTDARYFLYFQF